MSNQNLAGANAGKIRAIIGATILMLALVVGMDGGQTAKAIVLAWGWNPAIAVFGTLLGAIFAAGYGIALMMPYVLGNRMPRD